MLFNSYLFLFFYLPVALGGFLVLGRFAPRRVTLTWLILVSLGFYAWWNPPYVFLIVGSIIANYIIAKLIWRTGSRIVLAGGIVMNLGLLGYYKYAGFLVGNFDKLLGTDWTVGHILLPLAISFFTFTQIAYLVDTYRKDDWTRGGLEYAGFVTFFPHLLMGPIVFHKELVPQFQSPHFGRVNVEAFSVGLSLFAMGLFKKVVLADSLMPYADSVFGSALHGQDIGFYGAWFGAVAFIFQVYFDFSSYSDMALGLARLFGLHLPVNFDSPYKAHGFRDLWRRWHLTLTRFFIYYVYVPLGGNRRGKVLAYFNLMLIMTLVGFWHGAAWTFVVWGFAHGILVALNHAWRQYASDSLQAWWNGGIGRILGIAHTFLWFIVLGVFFRAKNFSSAISILTSMAGLNGFHWSHLHTYFPFFGGIVPLLRIFPVSASQTSLVLGFLAFCAALIWLSPNSQQILGRYKPGLETFKGGIYRYNSGALSWKPSLLWAIFIGVIAWVSVLAITTPRPFIYFHF